MSGQAWRYRLLAGAALVLLVVFGFVVLHPVDKAVAPDAIHPPSPTPSIPTARMPTARMPTLAMPPSVAYAPILTPPPAKTAVMIGSPSPSATIVPTLPVYPPTATAAPTATRAIAETLADRYGVIVTGMAGNPADAIEHIVGTTGARWWYQYVPGVPDTRDAAVRQVRLLRFGGTPQTGAQLNAVKVEIAAAPHNGGYWMISNEPNIEGQDNLDPDVYARGLHDIADTIRAVDPKATLIGPNVLNWQTTCVGCPGFESGQNWTTRMRTAYRARYNSEPPLDVWSLHTYNLNWSRLPMLDTDSDQAQITTMRAYLDAVPALRGKPIWLTEFGVIWGYEGMQWAAVDGAYRVVPTGAYRSDLVRNYFNTTLNWLEANATRLNVRRWFVYTSYGTPEPFTNTFTGVSLFAAPPQPGVQLTEFGTIYADHIRRATTILLK